jgi:hypothetical protein
MNTRIRTALIVAAFALLVLPATSEARTLTGNEVFGVGLQLGDPTAITAKILPVEVFGFQFYLGGGGWGWNDYYHSMFLTGIDVIFHPWVIYDGWKTCALNLTIGGGVALGLFRGWYYADWDGHYVYDRYYYRDEWYATMFIRLVTGVSLWFKKFPLECFVEANPAIGLFRPVPIYFQLFWVGAGARWWF